MVSNIILGLEEIRIKKVFFGGSSKNFNNALADSELGTHNFSASNIKIILFSLFRTLKTDEFFKSLIEFINIVFAPEICIL